MRYSTVASIARLIFPFGEKAVVLVPFISLFSLTYLTASANQLFCGTSPKPETLPCCAPFRFSSGAKLPLFEVVPSFAVVVPTEVPSTSTV